ncbi:G protein-regulated inducer of neurite outgrowth 3 [Vombatus ursinus]|uniref:G protein-regulated inducer of neurite outgrowth C-terminal domain-containing protein n=1 Tax=Vombatus ursinus TaxID=29139 RepID=A0A4X2M128_VOMUR|nr:G protein-regulated inducer of neurite outgrowth 3 [Vombatus ursinus]
MGTVPDPLRLTKTSLTVASEDKEELQGQHPSIPQPPSIIAYTNANSLPCFPSESVRVGLLDLSGPGPVETIMKDSENDLTQTVMSSEISSEDEKLPPTYNSPPESSSEHVAQIRGPVVDLTITHSVNQDASHPTPCDEPKTLTDAVSLTTADQSSRTSPQSSLTSKHSVCPTEQEKTLKTGHLFSRFKETGTMTSLDESGFLAEERANRTWQDAEVQAVTSMESRSVSTSPSIFATFLRKIPPFESLEQQEQLCVIYQSNSDMNNPSELSDKLVGPRKAPCHFDNKTEVLIQAATGDSSNIPTFQVENKSTDSAATVYQMASDNRISGLRASSDTKTTCKEKQQAVEMVTKGESQIITQPAPTTFIPPNAKPVDQISTHACNQTDVSHDLGKAETKSSDLSMKTIKSIPSNKPLSPDNELNKADNLNVTDKDNTTEKPLPTQVVKELGTDDPKADIKPKAETKSELLCPNAEGLTVVTPTTGRKNQDKASEESKQAKTVTSLGLPGESMGESSPNSGKRTPSRSVKASPRRPSRVSEFLKEQKLNVTAAAAQVGFTPGEKKKQLGSDGKLQFKQSKQVRDVIWDEQGMTWEVYGASLDPESLGIAIQNHLQRQIREHEKLIKVQSNQNRKSISSDTSSNKKLKGRQHNVFQAVMQNFRRPNCCVHPAPSSVLD